MFLKIIISNRYHERSKFPQHSQLNQKIFKLPLNSLLSIINLLWEWKFFIEIFMMLSKTSDLIYLWFLLRSKKYLKNSVVNYKKKEEF